MRHELADFPVFVFRCCVYLAGCLQTVLKEPFGFQEFLFTGGTALGVTLCACATLLPHDEFVNMGGGSVFSSAGSSTGLSEEEVGLYSWRDPWYLAYLACCVVPGFGTLIYVNSEESAVLEERERMIMSSSPHLKNKRIEMTTTTSRLSSTNPSSQSVIGGQTGAAGGVTEDGPPMSEGRDASLGGGNSQASPKTKVLR